MASEGKFFDKADLFFLGSLVTVFSCFWACPEAGQQVEGGSADPDNLQNPAKKKENVVAFVCHK